MTRQLSREVGIDAALVIAGAGASLLFVCTGGNGRSPLPLLGPLAIGIAINAAACLVLARIVTKSSTLAALEGTIITELVYLNLAMHSVARANRVDPCVAMLPMIIVFTTFPMVALGSLGFSRLGVALWGERQDQRTQPTPGACPDKAADDLTGNAQE